MGTIFDLEQSIAEWRRQMLAVGINTPVPLEELENHLREEIAHQMQSGLNEPEAFELAARRIGRSKALKTEFAKTRDLFAFLGDNKSTKTNRLLGALWFAGCLCSFNTMFWRLISTHAPGISPATTLFWMNVLVMFIYVAGMVGSIGLFCGAKLGRSLVRMFALLMAVSCVAEIFIFELPAEWRMWCGLVALFSLVSIVLLNSPPNTKPNAAVE